jgi:hypothetical protein
MGRSTLELHPIAIFRRFSFPERAPRPAVAEVRKDGWLARIYRVTGVGATLLGRDGGVDRYFTDGEMTIGVLAIASRKDQAAEDLSNPPVVQLKEQLWSAVRQLLRSLPEPGSRPNS